MLTLTAAAASLMLPLSRGVVLSVASGLTVTRGGSVSMLRLKGLERSPILPLAVSTTRAV